MGDFEYLESIKTALGTGVELERGEKKLPKTDFPYFSVSSILNSDVYMALQSPLFVSLFVS